VRTVTLYSKPGCHLCEAVRAMLDDLRGELGFRIDEVDISRDAALLVSYRLDIPVLMVDGVEIGRGRIEESDLMAALTSR
jgi:glutaredoxin